MMERGRAAPLGAHWDGEGVNFAVYSGCAEQVHLCLFDPRGKETARHPMTDQQAGIWHGYLPDVGPGQQYGYRVQGPWAPEEGRRCNPAKLLIDPYARSLAGDFTWSPAVYDYLPGSGPGKWRRSHLDSAGCIPKGVVTAASDPLGPGPRVPWSDKVIYEANVRGFTMRHPELTGDERGRFRGMANGRIVEYLKSLGITSVELMPVHDFIDEAFLVGRGMRNLWGYNSFAFFAAARRYGHSDPRAEFREMVGTLHEAGLEVILDVVYNHTAESGQRGPTVNLRGFDNLAYYRTDPAAAGRYLNLTGCGNAINTDHPVVQDLILDSLAYWHGELGVDGFRFDLAVTLGRNERGFDPAHPLLQRLDQDPRLEHAALIAEPWDVGHDGYQLGRFPPRWSEWNDQYRDGVRAFWRGDRGTAGAFAERLHGSADIFETEGRGPRASVNYVTSHDGLTLTDVVSYEQRHNHANGEHNRDGHAHNLSRNYGVEGPTSDPAIRDLRRRQRLNLLASLLFSQGTPMLLAGDEFGNSQLGNNNAYCQDNESGWLDWSGLEEDPQFREQVRGLIRLRRANPLLRQPRYVHGHEGPCIDWLHASGRAMGPREWQRTRRFALLLSDGEGSARDPGQAVLILVNRSRSGCDFRLPERHGRSGWQLAFHSGGEGAARLNRQLCRVGRLTMTCLESGA